MTRGCALRGARGERAAVALGLGCVAAVAFGGCGSGKRVSGRAVFASDCAVCHSISGRALPQQQDGDLRALRLPREQLVQYAREMPVVTKPLSRAEVQAVVDYMRSVQRR